MTERKKRLKESLLQLCTFGILILLAGILFLLLSSSLYALLFDRSVLLLGIHLKGWVAGAILAAKVAVEAVLIALIIRYPSNSEWLVKISLVLSALLLVDSIVTSKGYPFISPVYGIFFFVSVGLVVLRAIDPSETEKVGGH
jgi:hypothetical protein